MWRIIISPCLANCWQRGSLKWKIKGVGGCFLDSTVIRKRHVFHKIRSENWRFFRVKLCACTCAASEWFAEYYCQRHSHKLRLLSGKSLKHHKIFDIFLGKYLVASYCSHLPNTLFISRRSDSIYQQWHCCCPSSETQLFY